MYRIFVIVSISPFAYFSMEDLCSLLWVWSDIFIKSFNSNLLTSQCVNRFTDVHSKDICHYMMVYLCSFIVIYRNSNLSCLNSNWLYVWLLIRAQSINFILIVTRFMTWSHLLNWTEVLKPSKNWIGQKFEPIFSISVHEGNPQIWRLAITDRYVDFRICMVWEGWEIQEYTMDVP